MPRCGCSTPTGLRLHGRQRLRCMAKYLYDNGIVRKEEMTLETDKGTKTVRVYTTDGRVTSACVDMGYATLDTTALRLNIPKRRW